MKKLRASKSNKKTLSVLENIEKISAEVEEWPKWKLHNTLLAFSEYQSKKRSKKGIRGKNHNEKAKKAPQPQEFEL